MYPIRYIRSWFKSWYELIPLNYDYFRARLKGYEYYIELNIDIAAQRHTQQWRDTSPQGISHQAKEIEDDMSDMGAQVLIVRRVRRRNYRSKSWRLYAVFKDEESAILFKLQEGDVGNLQKFKPWFKGIKK